jgi:hypothetical protein
MTTIEEIDAMIALPAFAPYWGFHDDHRDKDGTPEYRPALMQVRGEFEAFVEAIEREFGPKGGHSRRAVLQLGMGNCIASHTVWRFLFNSALTIDMGISMLGTSRYPAMDTHSEEALNMARHGAPYDLLFIDAGHSYEDVEQDYSDYGPLVRQGGIIAFHDSLPRAEYPEVGVPAFVATFKSARMITIGREVGISWLIK